MTIVKLKYYSYYSFNKRDFSTNFIKFELARYILTNGVQNFILIYIYGIVLEYEIRLFDFYAKILKIRFILNLPKKKNMLSPENPIC